MTVALSVFALCIAVAAFIGAFIAHDRATRAKELRDAQTQREALKASAVRLPLDVRA